MSNDKNENKRAQKSSKIPSDYDPTPQTFALPDGDKRPDQKSHVPPNLVNELLIKHPLVTADITEQGTLDRKYRFLIGKVVSIGGEFWVKDKETGFWRIRKRGEVKACLLHDWQDRLTKFNICVETMDAFFAGHRYLVLDNTVCVPGGEDFLWFNGKKCLNLGAPPQCSYDPDNVGSTGFDILMALIDQNLLANQPRPLADIYEEIEAGKGSLTKWFFHWLASIYQRPGRQLSTALWLIGSQQGVGKTQFTNALSQLVGPGNAQQINLGELKNDWNDFLEGTQLAIADEVKLDSKRDFYDMLKRYIGSPTISLRKRNQGQYLVPNITNWIFTTNASRPVVIEPSDRRNTFIATTESEDARKLASKFYKLSAQEKQNAVEGLAALLGSINIDDAFINKAFWTPLKDQLSEMSDKPLLTWLKTDEAELLWPVGVFMRSETITKKFIEWATANGVYSGERSASSINQQLGELVNAGWIEKARGYGPKKLDGTKPRWRGFNRLKSFPVGLDEEYLDVELAPIEMQSEKLGLFKSRMSKINA